MQRQLSVELTRWKDHLFRKPLILRGVRQVGKSYLATELGKTFLNCVTLNFERDPAAKTLFQQTKDPQQLLVSIAAFKDQKIIPGDTLLFFDEIQECVDAIQSLRYFKEELPELHVIAAGSLLDFVLESIGIPVGRVQFLYVHPLSFSEYLQVTGKSELNKIRRSSHLAPALHQKLLEEMRHYMWLGGMPAVVDAWRLKKDVHYCQEIQDEILLSYRQDFEKYAKKHQVPLLNKLLDHVGAQLGHKFKYSNVDVSIRSYALKAALELLQKACVVEKISHTSAQGFPLSANTDSNKFKIFFFDIGLLQRLQKVNLKEWMIAPMSVTYLGALAEQFVCQEFIASTSIATPPELFYWHREEKQSNAEIDFVFNIDHKIIPVEVKSGSSGRLKSMQLFLDTHPNSKEGWVISENQPWEHGALRGIPLYAFDLQLSEFAIN